MIYDFRFREIRVPQLSMVLKFSYPDDGHVSSDGSVVARFGFWPAEIGQCVHTRTTVGYPSELLDPVWVSGKYRASVSVLAGNKKITINTPTVGIHLDDSHMAEWLYLRVVGANMWRETC